MVGHDKVSVTTSPCAPVAVAANPKPKKNQTKAAKALPYVHASARAAAVDAKKKPKAVLMSFEDMKEMLATREVFHAPKFTPADKMRIKRRGMFNAISKRK